MKADKINLLMLFVLFSINTKIFADSPLTSTPYSAAYGNEYIIIIASETNGLLTTDLMNFLADETQPIALKMAVINELGWEVKGKNNASIFFDHLKQNNGYRNENHFLRTEKGYELLCFAYLMAMDNYFNVDNAIDYAEKALQKNPESFTFNLITAIIKAQKAMNSDWCEVYRIADKVRKNISLIRDMNDEAVKIIFDYISLYKKYC